MPRNKLPSDGLQRQVVGLGGSDRLLQRRGVELPKETTKNTQVEKTKRKGRPSALYGKVFDKMLTPLFLPRNINTPSFQCPERKSGQSVPPVIHRVGIEIVIVADRPPNLKFWSMDGLVALRLINALVSVSKLQALN